MATRSDDRTKKNDNKGSSAKTSTGSPAAFDWGSAGALAGVALGGAALAFAANMGRKLAIQGLSATKGNWAESLAAEHDMVLALFDKALDTDDTQTKQRKMLLMQIGHALDKHAYAEEHVVYPALREANEKADADQLEHEHGEVKTFLYRLANMAADSAEWLPTVTEFRASVSAHARMEEDEVFPRLRSEIDDVLDAKITRDVNKAGFMMA